MDTNSPTRPGVRSDFVAGEATQHVSTSDLRRSNDQSPDPYADEPRWPAWKVSLFVIVFSAASWWAIAYVASRLFG